MIHSGRMGKKVRTREPRRSQGWLFVQMPGAGLEEGHPARLLAAAVERLDVTAFVEGARAVEGHAGRPCTSPRLLLTLWLYGLSQGVGSASELARRCRTDEAYRWLAGGVDVSHDALSAFLVGHRPALQGLFTQVLGLLLAHGLVDLQRLALDGTRIRASACAPSFRSREALEACRQQAALHLEAVLAQADAGEEGVRQRAAQVAAARAYARRVEEALGQLESRQQQEAGKVKSHKAQGPLRASTTDADARVMKMADGGFRPAYNLQLGVAGAPEGGPRTVVGVEVTNQGSDSGLVQPMLHQVQRRTGQRPEALLADGGYATLQDIKGCADRGVRPVISVPERMRRPGAQADTSAQVGEWRARMDSPEGKAEYRARASLVECVNGQLKGRLGLTQVRVRGLHKVGCVGLMAALTHNLLTHGPALLAALG